MCVCVRERERERERNSLGNSKAREEMSQAHDRQPRSQNDLGLELRLVDLIGTVDGSRDVVYDVNESRRDDIDNVGRVVG